MRYDIARQAYTTPGYYDVEVVEKLPSSEVVSNHYAINVTSYEQLRVSIDFWIDVDKRKHPDRMYTLFKVVKE